MRVCYETCTRAVTPALMRSLCDEPFSATAAAAGGCWAAGCMFYLHSRGARPPKNPVTVLVPQIVNLCIRVCIVYTKYNISSSANAASSLWVDSIFIIFFFFFFNIRLSAPRSPFAPCDPCPMNLSPQRRRRREGTDKEQQEELEKN